MNNVIQSLKQRRIVGIKQALKHGTTPAVNLTHAPAQWLGGWLFFCTALLVFVMSWIPMLWLHLEGAFKRAATLGLMAGLIIALLYTLLPLLSVLGFVLWHRARPSRQRLSQFSNGQKFICLGWMAFGWFVLMNHLVPLLHDALRDHRWPTHGVSIKPFVTLWWHQVVIWLVLLVFMAFFVPLLFPKETKRVKKRLKRADRTTPFGLWCGRSTGALSRLGHGAGLRTNLEIVLSTEDAAQNILILGGIGAGKTTRMMQPLLAQLLEQETGGLLFDIKGDVKRSIIQLAEMTNRQVTLIGPHHNPMNLLAGLTPEVAASFLKSAFLLSGGLKLDGFWIDTATELCRNTLGLLSFLPQHYTLQGLYSYLFDEEMKETLQKQLNPLLVTLDHPQQRLLKTYLRYHDMIFESFDEKVKSGVNATVAQVLAPFNHPELVDAFCQQPLSGLNMQSVLDGAIYLVELPLSHWGLGGKVAYTFIKLRFFNLMQSRHQHPEWNQERPIFFMCDEYQEIVSANKDGLSDLNFWDKSRSSKTLGIISAQSVSSFYAALGDRDLSCALLQNFRQKFCFRTEDEATLTMMDHLAGRAKVQRKTISQTTGKSRSAWTAPRSRHHSSTQSITETREAVLDAALFRNLTPNQAVALLSLQGHSMDDVLELMPLFL